MRVLAFLSPVAVASVLALSATSPAVAATVHMTAAADVEHCHPTSYTVMLQVSPLLHLHGVPGWCGGSVRSPARLYTRDKCGLVLLSAQLMDPVIDGQVIPADGGPAALVAAWLALAPGEKVAADVRGDLETSLDGAPVSGAWGAQRDRPGRIADVVGADMRGLAAIQVSATSPRFLVVSYDAGYEKERCPTAIKVGSLAFTRLSAALKSVTFATA